MRDYIPLFLLVILLAGWAVFFDRATDHFIFEPSRQVYSLQLPFKRVSFPSQEGSPLYALYLPARDEKPTLLFFHGSNHNIYSFQDFILPYANEGFGIFLFDYRGYGRSEGKPSEQKMYQDAQSALSYVTQQLKIKPQNLVLWGFALGTAPALYLAAQPDALPWRAVILQSPFTNTPEMGFYMLAQKKEFSSAAAVLTLLLKPILWNKQFDNTQRIGAVKAPLLIGFSRMDDVVPWTMSRALSAKAPEGTEVFFSPSGAHYTSEWFEPTVRQFLEDNIPLTGQEAALP